MSCKVVVFDFDSTLTCPLYLADKKVWAIADKPEVLASLTAEQRFENFGGRDRIAMLQELLSTLHARNVELFIISIGYKEAIVPLLEAVGLLEHFRLDQIFGQDSPELVNRNYVKGALIADLSQRYGWTKDDVLFVDDSEKHIKRAKTVAHTILVRPPTLGTDDIIRILDMVIR